MGPNPICLKEKFGHERTHGENATGARRQRSGRSFYKAKECYRLPVNHGKPERERSEQILPQPSERTSPTDVLFYQTSRRTMGQQTSTIETTQFVVFCHGGPRRLTQCLCKLHSPLRQAEGTAYSQKPSTKTHTRKGLQDGREDGAIDPNCQSIFSM